MMIIPPPLFVSADRKSVILRPGRTALAARADGCRAEGPTLRLLEPGRGSPRRTELTPTVGD